MSDLVKTIEDKIKFLNNKKRQHLRYSVTMMSVNDIEELITLLTEVKEKLNE